MKRLLAVCKQKGRHLIAGFDARHRLRNFVGLAFQTRPFKRLRIVRAAVHHFLAANHDYDVANQGSAIASDGNLWRRKLIGHCRVNRISLDWFPDRGIR